MSGKKRYANKFSVPRAKNVFWCVDAEWKKRAHLGIYHGQILPQDRYVLLGLSGKELALFFFYAVLGQRGGVVSDRPMKIWWRFKREMPEAFEPESVVKKLSPQEILSGLKLAIEAENGGKVRAGGLRLNLKEISRYWYENSVELVKFWGSDPRNIFWGVKNFKEVFARISRPRGETCFKGIGMKLFALFVIFLHERELIEYFPSVLPMDIHTMRVFLSTKMIKESDWMRTDRNIKDFPQQLTGRPSINVYYDFPNDIALWSGDFMERYGFSHLGMNSAFYLLSRNLCSKAFHNRSRDKAQLYFEVEELKNLDVWPKNYKDPCRVCPIERWCEYAVPTAPYWIWGVLVRLGPRVSYPKMIKQRKKK